MASNWGAGQASELPHPPAGSGHEVMDREECRGRQVMFQEAQAEEEMPFRGDGIWQEWGYHLGGARSSFVIKVAAPTLPHTWNL